MWQHVGLNLPKEVSWAEQRRGDISLLSSSPCSYTVYKLLCITTIFSIQLLSYFCCLTTNNREESGCSRCFTESALSFSQSFTPSLLMHLLSFFNLPLLPCFLSHWLTWFLLRTEGSVSAASSFNETEIPQSTWGRELIPFPFLRWCNNNGNVNHTSCCDAQLHVNCQQSFSRLRESVNKSLKHKEMTVR